MKARNEEESLERKGKLEKERENGKGDDLWKLKELKSGRGEESRERRGKRKDRTGKEKKG